MAAASAQVRHRHATGGLQMQPALQRLRPGLWGMLAIAFLAAMLGLYLAIGWSTTGDQADMANGKVWIRWLTRNGVQDAYRIAMDYPPAPPYLVTLAGTVYERAGDPTFNEKAALASQSLTQLWTLPGFLCQPVLAPLG